MPAGKTTTVAETIGPIAPPAKLQRSSAAATPKNPRDLTGVRKQQLEMQHAADLATREAEIATATVAAYKQRADEVVDYSQGGASAPGTAPGEVVEEVPEEIEVEAPVVRIRVNAPIEDMVFGRAVGHPGDPENGLAPVPGNLQFYNFEEGVQYDVPRALAEHLERIGYLYH
jgi:hypothetical protein